ncbi:pentapeptide repeat-containing protein [Aureispira anguillae]|uniref:Pentapeptide repeat-containing protein n=1 Tax=Aureispira anguillae TaxID=2864201 RepID=A0A915YKP4_9BACT|nr:pentapeptide repeat-containing protein [Aureispira anguillae]BDS14722.1 pentapeptide repeat-containing protein [Aureispira anguillae]
MTNNQILKWGISLFVISLLTIITFVCSYNNIEGFSKILPFAFLGMSLRIIGEIIGLSRDRKTISNSMSFSEFIFSIWIIIGIATVIIFSSINAPFSSKVLGHPEFSNIDWSGKKLNQTSLKSARLDNALLVNVLLDSSDLSYSFFSNTNLSFSNLRHSNLSYITWDSINLIFSKMQGANLYGANLNFSEMYGANLDNANLKNANLSFSRMQGTNLYYANLSFSKMQGTNLNGANLSFSRMQSADLENADLHDADLRGANLRGANLKGAHLSRIKVNNTNFIKQLEQWDCKGIQEIKDKYYVDLQIHYFEWDKEKKHPYYLIKEKLTKSQNKE